MLSTRKFAAAAIAAFMLSHAAAFAEDAKDKVVAKVGDLEIYQSELDLAVANLDPQLAKLPPEQKEVAALSGAIDLKLLAGSAMAEGLENDADFKMRMRYLKDRELHNTYFQKHVVDTVTDDEVKARYEKEIAAMPKQEEVHARHILLKTEDEAKAVIAELDKGADFVTLAKEKSNDPAKSEGGDLGWFTKGRMVPEFEEAAFALPVGTYTKTPVKTQFGYHVIKVEEKRDVAPPPLDQVKDQVRQLVMRDKYVALLQEAKDKTKVDILDETLRKGYEDANKAPEATEPTK